MSEGHRDNLIGQAMLPLACVGLALSTAANVAGYLGQSWLPPLFILFAGVFCMGFVFVLSSDKPKGRRIPMRNGLSRK